METYEPGREGYRRVTLFIIPVKNSQKTRGKSAVLGTQRAAGCRGPRERTIFTLLQKEEGNRDWGGEKRVRGSGFPSLSSSQRGGAEDKTPNLADLRERERIQTGSGVNKRSSEGRTSQGPVGGGGKTKSSESSFTTTKRD